MQSKVMSSDSKQMGKAYRQFSRRRYKELKSSLRSVRESQIVQMIIREWDSIPMLEKNKLCSGKNGNLLSTPAKMEEDMVRMDLKNKSNAKTTGKKMKQEEMELKSSSEPIQEQINSSQLHKLPNSMPMKTKAIQKRKAKLMKMGDYISFYKMNYKMIMESHPNWTPSQASLIIGLMWKKNKMAMRSNKSTVSTMKKPLRMSGRMLFGKLKRKQGANTMMVKRMWRKLPFESKMMWTQRGNPEIMQAKKSLTMRMPMEKMAVGLKMLMNTK